MRISPKCRVNLFAILPSQKLNEVVFPLSGLKDVATPRKKKTNLQQGLSRCQSFISLFVWQPRAELLEFKSTMFVWEHVSHLSLAKINNCQGSGSKIRSSGQTLTDIINAKVCLCITSVSDLSLHSNENHVLSSHHWQTNTKKTNWNQFANAFAFYTPKTNSFIWIVYIWIVYVYPFGLNKKYE